MSLAFVQGRVTDDVYQLMLDWVKSYPCEYIIKRERKSRLGDFSFHPTKGNVITVNENLNQYSFLVTLTHESAHLIAFTEHGRSIQPHGKEWKTIFGGLLRQLVRLNAFPKDLSVAVLKHAVKPKASSHSDSVLRRALMQYDDREDEYQLLEDLEVGERFTLKGGKSYEILEKRRSRFLCVQLDNSRKYLVNKLAEIEPNKG